MRSEEFSVFSFQFSEFGRGAACSRRICWLKENASDNTVEKDLDAFSKERLPERDVAMQYRFIDKLPLTPVGKVDYRALEQQAEQ